MAVADGGHGGWWLTDQGQGDKQALSSAPAIDFSSEVSAWYGSSQGRPATKARASRLLAWKGRCNIIIMASQNQGYDMCTASIWYQVYRKQCRRHRGTSLCCTRSSYSQLFFVLYIVIEFLSEHFEWKLDCTAWIKLQLHKNHDDRTFIISH